MRYCLVVISLACALSPTVHCQLEEDYNVDYTEYEKPDESGEPIYDNGPLKIPPVPTSPPRTPQPIQWGNPTQPPPRPNQWGTTLSRPRPAASTGLPPNGPLPVTNPGIDGNGQLIGCPCVATQETNRVCGTDGNTYGNMGKLKCAQRCGHAVELNFHGRCRKKMN